MKLISLSEWISYYLPTLPPSITLEESYVEDRILYIFEEKEILMTKERVQKKEEEKLENSNFSETHSLPP